MIALQDFMLKDILEILSACVWKKSECRFIKHKIEKMNLLKCIIILLLYSFKKVKSQNLGQEHLNKVFETTLSFEQISCIKILLYQVFFLSLFFNITISFPTASISSRATILIYIS